MSTFGMLLAVMAASAPPGSAPALPPNDPPPLSTLVQQVLDRDNANVKALQSMEYHETMKTERLDGSGKVTQKQQLWMIVRPGAREEIQVLSEKGDSLPSDPDEAALKAQGKEAQKKQVVFTFKDMANRFTVNYLGKDVILGQPVYVLAFEPKPNQPYRSQTEKVLNYLHGRLWVSTRDYTVLKTEATLAQPVEIAWIFADVSALDFKYELNNTSGGMGPARIETSVKVDAPLISIRQRMTIDMTQFGPRSKTD